MDVFVTVTLVIVVALVFDFTNGFHDTANAMATSVATGALKPKVAVLISAVLTSSGRSSRPRSRAPSRTASSARATGECRSPRR